MELLKAVCCYWLIGCALSGLAMGWHMQRCPNDRVTNGDVLTTAATWPASFFAALTAPNPVPLPACEAKP